MPLGVFGLISNINVSWNVTVQVWQTLGHFEPVTIFVVGQAISLYAVTTILILYVLVEAFSTMQLFSTVPMVAHVC